MKVLDVQDRMKAIVPPIEMCREIPEGEFKETVFICCVEREGKTRIAVNTELAREVAAGDFASIYPAPTLEEIVTDLGSFRNCDYCEDHIIIGSDCYHYPSEAGQALALWFEIRKKHQRLIGGAW